MIDNIHPDGRPLTVPEMFRRLAVMAESTDDYTTLLPGISHVETEVRLAIDRKRPGWEMDQMLGARSPSWTATALRKFRNLESDHD